MRASASRRCSSRCSRGEKPLTTRNAEPAAEQCRDRAAAYAEHRDQAREQGPLRGRALKKNSRS